MLRQLILPIVSLLLLVPRAEGQVARVFVSVNGNDANVCSNVTTPCRTLAGGIAQVDPDGEVIVIESGSYAGGTITKPVKVNVAPGVVAFSALSIVVNPGAGNKVVLRGLTIKAAVVGTGAGIDHLSGILYVENTVVDGWDTGLASNVNELRAIKGSTFRNNKYYGVYSNNPPIFTARLTVDDSFVENNGVTGIYVGGGSARVSNTVITGHDSGAVAQYPGADVTVESCQIWGNSFGLAARDNGLLRVSGSNVTRNGTGLLNAAAILISFGNNAIDGNTTNTFGAITAGTLQ
jgi:hypothetical protein